MSQKDKNALMWTALVGVGLVLWYMWDTKSGVFMPAPDAGGTASNTGSNSTTSASGGSSAMPASAASQASSGGGYNNGIMVPVTIYQPASTMTGIPTRRLISSCV